MSNCQEIFRAGVVLVSACAQVGPDFLWPESAANEQWPGQAREEFLLSSASASYAAFMIKVASMGQQAGVDQSRQAGKSLLLSTVIGGIGAIVGWQVLSIWPSLLIYVLLIGLGGLIMGPRIFAGAGMHPAGPTWSYAYLTMIVVLAPAVLDGQTGASADAAFWSRLQMFIWATIYGTGAVFVFDTLWRRKPSREN